MRLALVLVLLLASPAVAAEGLLVASGTQMKIPIWRSAQAQDDGQAVLGPKADGAL